MKDTSPRLFGARGPLAVLGQVWAWLTRRGKVKQRELPASAPMPAPARVPVAAQPGARRVQLPETGDGALYHRRYGVQIADAKLTITALVREVGLRFAQLSPAALAEFEKTNGHPWALRVGDEFDITMLGPWDGAVRVVEVKPDSFRFATLEGHPEAGQIRFSASQVSSNEAPKNDPSGSTLRFQIESWARSRDAVVDLAYGAGGKAVQESAWVQFLEGVVELSGGQAVGQIQVETQSQPFEASVMARG